MLPLRMLRNSQPVLVAPNAAGCDPAVQVFGEAMMAGDVVALAALLMQPEPPALFVFEIVTPAGHQLIETYPT